MKIQTSSRLCERILCGYLCFAAVIFAGTAVAKLLSDFSNPDLRGADPFVRFISAKHLMIFVAILEIGVATFILKNLFRAPKSGLFAVLWLTGLFVIYRIGFAFSPDQGVACKCFGVGTLIGKSEAMEDLASMILLFLLLVPGGILLWMMRENRNVKSKIAAKSVVILCFFIAGSSKTFAQELMFEPLFTAQGVDEREIIDMQDNARKLDPIFFEISKDAHGNWQHNHRVYISDSDMTSWMHSSSDGTNVYETVHATKIMMPDGSHELIQNVFTGATHPAEIRHSTPSDATGGTAWLAFFGGDYLTKNPEAWIPLYIRRYEPINWAYDFEYEWFEESKSPLLKSGNFRLNHDLLFEDMIHYPEVWEPSEEMLQRIIYDIKWHRKFAKHAQKTNPELLMLASFQVEEIVSGENFSFPKKVRWERYHVNLTNVAMRDLTLRASFEITNWIVHPKGRQIPLLPKLTGTNVWFSDSRFMFRDDRKYHDFRRYELSDGIWPISTNDSRIAKSNMIFQPRTRLANRNFIYFLNVTLAIILFSLPAILWWRKRQRAK